MAAADTARMIASLDLADGKFQAGIRRSLGSLGRLDKGISGVGRNVGKIGKGLGKGAALLGGAAVGGLVLAGKAAIDFEDAFQGVVKTVEATPEQFDKISDAIRRMSTEMPISAIELAGIAEQAGALGIKANDIESFTQQVAILSTTTNVSADDAATALGQLGNVIGLQGPTIKDRVGDYQRFAAALVDLGNKGSSTESQILEITRRSGGAAHLLGIAKDATLGWSAAAANLGINQELAGTSLQNFFLKAQKASEGGDSLRDMAKIAGVSARDFKKSFDKDASGSLERFVKGLSKLPKDARLDAVQNLFGKGSGLTRLVLGLADSVDKNLTPSLDTSTQAWKDAAAAQAEFDKRNQTVRSALTRLKGGLIDAAVSIGEGFTPAVGRAADKLSAFLKQPANRKALQDIGRDIGKAIDSINWDKLLTVGKTLGSAFKPALDAIIKIAELIAALPPGVIGGAGALVVTDKLTGGAVSSGIGGVLGGLGSSLAKSLASQIPVFGKAFVQPVFVTNLGPGGLGGGPGGAAGGIGALGKLALVGEAIGLAAVVEAVREHFSDQSTAQGQAIQGDLEKNIRDPLFNVQAALNGVNQGISDIQSNPLNVLIQGDALNQLQAMRAELERELADRTHRDKDKNLPKPKTVLKNLKDDGIDLAAIARRRAKLLEEARLHPPVQPTPRDMDKNLPDVSKVLADLKASGVNIGAIAQQRLDNLNTGIGNVNSTARAGFAGVASTARAGLDNAVAATRSGTSGTTAATNVGASRIVGAIANNRPIVSTSVVVTVTASGVEKHTTTSQRYGDQNGSAGGGRSGASRLPG